MNKPGIITILFIITIAFAIGLLYPRPGRSEFPILESGSESARLYLIELSGNAYQERFSGTRALVRIDPAPPLTSNQYQVNIAGYPKKNDANTFVWNSDQSRMSVVGNEITCSIKGPVFRKENIHFFYYSPALFRREDFILTHNEPQRLEMARKAALPTKVLARAGRLKIKINATGISGTVWIKGYDYKEQAYVQYSATFHGKKTSSLEAKQEMKN